MSETSSLNRVLEQLQADFPGLISASHIAYDELTVMSDPAHIIDLMMALRDQLSFTQLIDLCGTDWPAKPKRFEIVYHLLSITRNLRIRVKVAVAEGEHVPSVIHVFPAADWYEREAYDMYGVRFDGHPHLKRILTDYNFKGHPLRKDFPLSGYVEIAYDEEKKEVVYQPVHLTQDYRDFDFTSPWEGPASTRGKE